MKKKNLGFLLVLTFLLTSCLFESSETGMDSWANTKGVPSTYKVHSVTVSDLKVSSAEAFMDTLPRSADTRGILGNVSNLKHDLAFDFAIKADTNFIKKMKDSDSSGAFLQLSLLKGLYRDKEFPAEALTDEEEVDVTLSWIIETSASKKFADSLSDVTDSIWYESLTDWETASTADTTFKISLANVAAKKDSLLYIDLPSALYDDLMNLKRYARIQLKLSLPNATKAYQLYGEDTNFPPFLKFWRRDMEKDSIYYSSRSPARMANLLENKEDCRECLVIHGGIFDSLVVEIPPEKILKALSDFYGDDFPVSADEKFDVRQYVMLAQLTMPRDDSKGSSELGLPIQVLTGSFIDSAGSEIRRMEFYRVDSVTVVEDGHQNLIFHEGDSLSLQLTYGVRDFLNRAQDGRGLKFIVRLGWPFLQEKDATYETYINDDGDTVRLRLDYFDYARYDFSSILESPMTLKLWLASKRDKED